MGVSKVPLGFSKKIRVPPTSLVAVSYAMPWVKFDRHFPRKLGGVRGGEAPSRWGGSGGGGSPPPNGHRQKCVFFFFIIFYIFHYFFLIFHFIIIFPYFSLYLLRLRLRRKRCPMSWSEPGGLSVRHGSLVSSKNNKNIAKHSNK